MKATGIVRNVDMLGRVVIPSELRRLYGIDTDTAMEFYSDEDGIVLRKYQPGCALCVAANGEAVPPGARCVSTSNRNFVGRQGTGARTHLASPAMAAAAAVAGHIADVRDFI